MVVWQVECESESELADLQRLVAFGREMRRLALESPPAEVMGNCERCALSLGRDALRQTLQSAVQGRIDDLEKKAAPRAGRPTARRFAARAATRAAS